MPSKGPPAIAYHLRGKASTGGERGASIAASTTDGRCAVERVGVSKTIEGDASPSSSSGTTGVDSLGSGDIPSSAMSKVPDGSSNMPCASRSSPVVTTHCTTRAESKSWSSKPRPHASIGINDVSIAGAGIAKPMGTAVIPRRCAFAARALRMRSSCCVFLTTLSGNGPGQRGSR
eukprot:193270-Pleurochrysis_carterae.AAC.3